MDITKVVLLGIINSLSYNLTPAGFQVFYLLFTFISIPIFAFTKIVIKELFQ